jgi:hypothetical protein
VKALFTEFANIMDSCSLFEKENVGMYSSKTGKDKRFSLRKIPFIF